MATTIYVLGGQDIQVINSYEDVEKALTTSGSDPFVKLTGSGMEHRVQVRKDTVTHFAASKPPA